jgi:transcriptional regulator with XRE-family HTH domain
MLILITKSPNMTDQTSSLLPSSDSVIAEIGARLAQRRIELDLTQAELAKQAGVGKRTVERLEAGGSTQLTNFVRILSKLDLLTEFMGAIPDVQPSPMELLRAKGKKPRKRVRHSTKVEAPKNPVLRESGESPSVWTWAE